MFIMGTSLNVAFPGHTQLFFVYFSSSSSSSSSSSPFLLAKFDSVVTAHNLFSWDRGGQNYCMLLALHNIYHMTSRLGVI